MYMKKNWAAGILIFALGLVLVVPAVSFAGTPPTITSGNAFFLVVGTSGGLVLSATGDAPITFSFDASDLPPTGTSIEFAGLYVHINFASTIPTGTYTFTIVATNADGSDTQLFTLYVGDPIALITNGTSTISGIGGTFPVQTNCIVPVTYSLGSSAPAGVTIDPTTGVLTIDPTTAEGIHSFDIMVRPIHSHSSSGRPFTLTVLPPQTQPAITSADAYTIAKGMPGTYPVAASGNPAPTFSLDGSEPLGVAIHATTGEMSIAATTAAGVHSFVITATNVVGSDTQPFTLTVAEKAPFGTSGGSAEPEPEPKQAHQKATVVGCKESANVRALPSTEAAICGQVFLGETIELLAWDETGTWCKILYNGGNNVGWLHGKFIR